MNDNVVEIKPSSNILEASEELNAAISNDPSILDLDALMNYALHNPDNQEAKELSLITAVDLTLRACEKDQEKMATLKAEKAIPGITVSEDYEKLSDENKKYIDDVIVYLDQVAKEKDKTNEEATSKWEEVRDYNQEEVDNIISEMNTKGRVA